MTDLVVAVRLKADGSGLVGQMRLSKEAVDELKAATEQAGGAAEAMAADMTRAGAAAERAGASTARAATATLALAVAEAKAKQAADALAEAQAKMSAAASASASEQERAAKAIEQAELRVERAKAAVARAASAGVEQQAAVAEKLAAAELRLSGQQERAAQAAAANAQAQERAAAELASAQLRQAQALQRLNRAQEESEQASSGATRSLGAQRAGYQQLGFQIQDITQSIALGTSGFTILAQQGGQTASALDQLGLKGAGGRLVSFLAGPLGAVLLATAAVLGPLALKFLDTGNAAQDAADKLSRAASGADVFGDAQSRLGKILDLTTGKLKNQNLVLVETIRLQALANLQAGREEQRQADKAARDFARPSLTERFTDLFGGLAAAQEGQGERAALRTVNSTNTGLAPVRAVIDQLRSDLSSITATPLDKLDTKQLEASIKAVGETAQRARVSIEQLRDAGKLGGRDLIEAERQATALAAAAQRQLGAQAELNAIDGRGIVDALKPDPKKKKPKSGAALAQFGESTGDRLDALTTRYTDLPAPVREAEQSLNQLNAIAREVEQRKPPNYAELKQQIDATRAAIIGGRDRGLGDAIEKIADGFDQTGAAAKRAAQGSQQLDDIVRYLNANLGGNPGFKPLIEQADRAKAAIEASVLKPYRDVIESQQDQLAVGAQIVKGHEDEAQALQIILNLRRSGLDVTKEQRAAILLGVQALRQQQRELEIVQRRQQNLLGFVGDVRGSIARAFAGESRDIAGDIVSAFRRAFAEQLTEKLFGNFFRDLNDKILGRKNVQDAGQRFSDAVNLTLDPLASLKSAATEAADSLRQVAGGGDTEANATAFAALLNKGSLSAAATAFAALLPVNRSAAGNIGDIVVTGKRTPDTDKSVKTIEQLIGQIATKGLNILGIDSKVASKLGDAIGGVVKGAGTGLAIAGIGQSLGIGLDNTGAAIGGALGKASGLPGAEIVWSIYGGLIGDLFKPTPKAKSGAITSTDGKVEISGNNGDAKNSVAQAVGQVQSGLQQIADQLGAQIGSFSVSIAKYKDSFRVDPTGSGSDGGKYGDRFVQGIGKFDNNDIQGAVSFAIADAIKDGAIKGISPAVAKALQSSTDVNKALREALKVRDLEAFIGGPAAALKKAFDDFDLLAQERVGLAKKYGLDLVELEKKTAEARTKLVEDSLKSSVGSIQQLLDNIRFGDLFEGTAAEQRRKLLAELDKAQADQAAGVEGAADRFASIAQQLIGKSRDAYGTAGPEYNADRSRVISGGEAIIKAEQERIDRAAGLQQAAVTAAQQSNTLLDEIAGLTATTNGKLDTLISAVNGAGGDLSGITINGGNYGNWWDAPQLGLTVRNALA